MRDRKRVAIVSSTQTEENRALIQGIGRFSSSGPDWNLFIDSSLRSIDSPDWLFETAWDGVILNCSAPRLAARCLAQGTPCVDTSERSAEHPEIPKARSDDFAIGQLAASHLRGLGYRSFAFCGYSEDPVSRQRYAGFRSQLRESLDSVRRFGGSFAGCTYSDSSAMNPFREETEVAALSKWIQTLPHQTAIFACDDWRSSQLAKACVHAGRTLPSDLSLLGVGNETLLCELSRAPLSSIDKNAPKRGSLAAELLQKLMDGGQGFEAAPLVPPLQVVARLSTSFDAVQDELVCRALKLIRARACKGVRVDEIVCQLRSSRRLLERKFKAALGKSPNVVIREAQVSEIKRLLSHTDKSISEIAYDTGFENPEYMHVVFKREEGTTPGAYRQQRAVTA